MKPDPQRSLQTVDQATSELNPFHTPCSYIWKKPVTETTSDRRLSSIMGGILRLGICLEILNQCPTNNVNVPSPSGREAD